MEREHQLAVDFIADRYPAAQVERGAEAGTVIVSAVETEEGRCVGPRWVIDENGCVASHDGAHPDLLKEYIDLHEDEMYAAGHGLRETERLDEADES